MRSNWPTILVYISVAFLLISLIHADYLFVPEGINFIQVSFSIVILFLGFFFSGLAWHRMLLAAGVNVRFVDSIRSIGLSIFGKYVPGKVWVIIGRSGYLAARYQHPMRLLTTISVNAQLMTLWSGLALGSLGLLLLNEVRHIGWLMIFGWVLLTISVFSDLFHRIITHALSAVTGKVFEFPQLSFVDAIKVLPFFLFVWGIWVIAFLTYCNSFIGVGLSLVGGLGFALAGSLGIMAVIAPGGLGVREGVLMGYLVLSGVEVKLAATIAIASRAWFLLGEVFVFVLAMSLKRFDKVPKLAAK